MNDTELWCLISEKIQKKREDIFHIMESGHYQDIEKYREDVGVLRGIKFVENVVVDIYKPKEKEE